MNIRFLENAKPEIKVYRDSDSGAFFSKPFKKHECPVCERERLLKEEHQKRKNKK